MSVKTNPNIQEVSPQHASFLAGVAIDAGLVPLIKSAPGVGKSSIAKAYAKKHNLKVIDIRLAQCDPVDLNGFPSIDRETGTASYMPMDTFPIATTEIPEGYDGWLIFFDELTSAAKAVQAAAYKVILDREIGQHKLHSEVRMMAAGNRVQDNAVAHPMSTALQSRMVHLTMRPDSDEWMTWASENNIDFRVLGYVGFQPIALDDFDPKHSDETFCCGRTLEMLSNIVKQFPDGIPDNLAPLIDGTIGQGKARDFINFCKLYGKLPSYEAVINNPEHIQFEDSMNVKWALASMVADRLERGDVESGIKFLERLGVEFEWIALKRSVRRDTTIGSLPAVSKWIKRISSMTNR